ncbi:hypothetical protein Poly30_15190 [Planctomycetes bacterium Poly30]|uniref:T9SS-like galactose binding domain-containing protein n=1 Tax=Saltatorellus ferox TaxID=2528018 RepID=A0A518EPK7_9BACT|nr:hypothetical protein Poly30_15190 [Planctomycetes bacterium Poly30]
MKQLLSLLGAACLFAPLGYAQGADDCANATPISGFNTFGFDNTNATGGGLSDCNGLGVRKDVWFRWTSPATGPIRFETCGTNTAFDTRIAVYDGINCGALNLLACAAQSCQGLSSVTFDAISGQGYLLRVGSRVVGAGGPGQFRVRAEPCPATNDDNFEQNDICDDAVVLGDGTYPNLWCAKGDPDWYEFCVPGGGTLTMDVLFATATGDIDIFALEGCAIGAASLGIGGSGTDDEQVVYTNPNATPMSVFLRVELWIDDPTEDCNDYTLMVTGAGGGCNGNSIGTNYCMPALNSTGASARITAIGSTTVTDNDVTLGAQQLPALAFGFFITSQTQGFVMMPGGSSGNLCVVGSVGRYVGGGQIQQSGLGGTIALPINLNQIPQPNGFVSAAPGQTWNFQAWYRDSSPTGPTSNFTDGLAITFQ